MGLKQILSSLETKPVLVELGNESIAFYPVRLRAILKAQSVIAEMAKAACALFDPNEEDYVKKTISKQKVNIAEDVDQEEMAEVEATVIDSISPVHAKERIKRRETAVMDAINALLSEENVQKVAILIEDSSRGACEIDAILDADPTVLMPILRGTLRANFSVFGGIAGKAMARAEKALGSALDGDAESPE